MNLNASVLVLLLWKNDRNCGKLGIRSEDYCEKKRSARKTESDIQHRLCSRGACVGKAVVRLASKHHLHAGILHSSAVPVSFIYQHNFFIEPPPLTYWRGSRHCPFFVCQPAAQSHQPGGRGKWRPCGSLKREDGRAGEAAYIQNEKAGKERKKELERT